MKLSDQFKTMFEKNDPFSLATQATDKIVSCK